MALGISAMCSGYVVRPEHSQFMGLKVKLPMLLEMDNKGAVNIANNWSILVVVPGLLMYGSVSCRNSKSPK